MSHMNWRDLAAAIRRHEHAAISDFGIRTAKASRSREIHLDVAFLSRLQSCGQIEVQCIALTDP